jgi:hypothetical protein
VQRLSVCLDGRLHIFREVGIGHWRVAEPLFIRLRQSDAFADPPARTLRRPDNRHGLVVMLHNHLDTVLDPDQHSMDIAGEFGLCDADRRHTLHDSVSACELSASGWPTVRDIGDTARARRWMVFYLEHRVEGNVHFRLF